MLTPFWPYMAPTNEPPRVIGDIRTSDCMIRVAGAVGLAPGAVPVEVMTAPTGFCVSGHVSAFPVGGYVAKYCTTTWKCSTGDVVR